MNVFEFEDYRAFLRAETESKKGSRGYKSALADAAGCQRSVFSQVLRNNQHLSRDHLAEISRFLGLQAAEEEFLILLLDLERAQSKRLAQIIRRRMEELKAQQLHRPSRLSEPEIQDPVQQLQYYSSWYWNAVHMLCTIPEFQAPPAIARRLELPLPLVQETLSALEKMGLVENLRGKWAATNKSLHLPVDSPLNEMNHTHWRMRALQDVQKKNADSTHYSLVCTLARADVARLQELLLSHILKERELIAPSAEEELYCITHDFFRI